MIDSHYPKHFIRAKKYYRIVFGLFVWTILFAQIFKRIEINTIVQSLLIAIPVLAAFVLVPLGLFNLIKSYTQKEPSNKYRTFFLIGYIFFLLIILTLILPIILDEINK